MLPYILYVYILYCVYIRQRILLSVVKSFLHNHLQMSYNFALIWLSLSRFTINDTNYFLLRVRIVKYAEVPVSYFECFTTKRKLPLPNRRQCGNVMWTVRRCVTDLRQKCVPAPTRYCVFCRWFIFTCDVEADELDWCRTESTKPPEVNRGSWPRVLTVAPLKKNFNFTSGG